VAFKLLTVYLLCVALVYTFTIWFSLVGTLQKTEVLVSVAEVL